MATAIDAPVPLRHLLLAIAVVAVWGTNFVVVHVALSHLPPLLLAALRFLFAFLPIAFFVRRPDIAWPYLAGYGLFIGVGQFGLVYIAMNGHISPGLASLVLQMQVFFTIGLSVRLAGESVGGYQWAALLLAASGIVIIGSHTDAATTPLGIALVLLAALSWSGASLVSKAAGKIDMFGFVVWSSVFSVPPLFLLSFLFEGPTAIAHGIVHADLATWVAVLWQTIGNTLFGYVAWSWLLARHPAAKIAPMTLLVPIFGLAASAWWLGEPLPAWKLAAAALVLSGLAIGIFYPRWRSARDLALRMPQ